jgi:beta-galactosidase
MKNISFFAAAMSLMAVVDCAAAEVQNLSDWRFSRDGGKAWENVSVPHDWAIAGPFDINHDLQKVKILENGEEKESVKSGRTGALPWVGSALYSRKVAVPEGAGYAALVFDGVMSECEVFAGGKKIGEWKHGYNAFIVEMPREAGEYEVVVKANNRPESSRWYPGAGIYRRVKFVTGGDTGLKVWGNAVYSPDLETVRVTSECRGRVSKIVHRMLDGGREIAKTGTERSRGNSNRGRLSRRNCIRLSLKCTTHRGNLPTARKRRSG